jgi:hypothetical protein
MIRYIINWKKYADVCTNAAREMVGKMAGVLGGLYQSFRTVLVDQSLCASSKGTRGDKNDSQHEKCA